MGITYRPPVRSCTRHDSFEEPAGGGAVAAVQLARLAGGAIFLTALGDDELARRSRARLAELAVTVHDATRHGATRRAHTFLDAQGERTITTIGERLEPRGRDPIGWEELAGADGVYLTAADGDALRAARAARVLVASPRAGRVLAQEGVRLDALVYSDLDELETSFARSLDPPPSLLVATQGRRGRSLRDGQRRLRHMEARSATGPDRRRLRLRGLVRRRPHLRLGRGSRPRSPRSILPLSPARSASQGTARTSASSSRPLSDHLARTLVVA